MKNSQLEKEFISSAGQRFILYFELFYIGRNNQCKVPVIVLAISLNMCFGYSKEPSH